MRARGHGAARGRLRDRDDQLQPGDRLDRLRHGRPALLRAAHLRGRARGGARRAAAAGRRRRRDLQLGGQTPLGLAQRLKDAGVPVLGTQPEAIDLAEHRGAFGRVLAEADLPAPKHGTAMSFDAGQGGRRRDRLPGAGAAVLRAGRARHGDRLRRATPGRPTSSRATADHRRRTRCWSTGSSTTRSRSTSTRCTTATELYLGGVMEHIEEAGIHSGDSACALPPITLGGERHRRGAPLDAGASRGASGCAGCSTCSTRWPATCSTCSRPTRARRGPCRSSRRRPRCRWPRRRPGSCSGRPSRELRAEGLLPADGDGGDAARATRRSRSRRRCCRSSASARRPASGVDSMLGPEMKSTGEVMGFDATFGTAFAKSQAAAYGSLPTKGHGVRVAWPTATSAAMIFPVKRLADLGFAISRPRSAPRRCCAATASTPRSCGKSRTRRPASRRRRADPGRRDRPGHEHAAGLGRPARLDGYEIRTAAVSADIPCLTTVQAPRAAVQGIEATIAGDLTVRSIQELHAMLRGSRAL